MVFSWALSDSQMNFQLDSQPSSGDLPWVVLLEGILLTMGWTNRKRKEWFCFIHCSWGKDFLLLFVVLNTSMYCKHLVGSEGF